MASFEPAELKSMVEAIRNIETALGNGDKHLMPSEISNRAVGRKSIVSNRPIKAGEIFTEENLTTKRPGTGVSPMSWDIVIGSKAARQYGADEMIDLPGDST
jgi:N,N'-diacetyllegionaminate synthase